jgi:hypothetical protein
MNNTLHEIIYSESCHSFKEALETGIKFVEKNLKE